ncbi:MAG: hypothetical protein ACOXZW_03065 [Bacilli bacterium]|jgi:hypothetical protein|nr:hypothetical protein [Bacilli bacterium]
MKRFLIGLIGSAYLISLVLNLPTVLAQYVPVQNPPNNDLRDNIDTDPNTPRDNIDTNPGTNNDNIDTDPNITPPNNNNLKEKDNTDNNNGVLDNDDDKIRDTDLTTNLSYGIGGAVIGGILSYFIFRDNRRTI